MNESQLKRLTLTEIEQYAANQPVLTALESAMLSHMTEMLDSTAYKLSQIDVEGSLQDIMATFPPEDYLSGIVRELDELRLTLQTVKSQKARDVSDNIKAVMEDLEDLELVQFNAFCFAREQADIITKAL